MDVYEAAQNERKLIALALEQRLVQAEADRKRTYLFNRWDDAYEWPQERVVEVWDGLTDEVMDELTENLSSEGYEELDHNEGVMDGLQVALDIVRGRSEEP